MQSIIKDDFIGLIIADVSYYRESAKKHGLSIKAKLRFSDMKAEGV